MSIYRDCDICGGAEKELTPEMFRAWGTALGAMLEPGAKFVMGGDVRTSTPGFLAALGDGLCRTGMDLVDLGVLPTPMIRYAKRRLGAGGCAMVTASHGEAGLNGLQWMLGDRPPTSKEVRRLKNAAEGKRPSAAGKRLPTERRSVDVTYDYVAWLQETWLDTPPIFRPAVLDPMHGAWACRARRYLQAVFPHSFFSSIHDTPDGALGGIAPDCARGDLLHDLSLAVEYQRAYVGVALDGDGDRVAFVDDEGSLLTAEETVWIFLQSFALELPGQKIVVDVRFSDRILEAIRQLGGEPMIERSGHAAVFGRMLESAALLGIESNGHYFFRDLAGGDDGLYAACRLISFLIRSGEKLSDLRRSCPEVFITPDLRVGVKPHARSAILQKVRDVFAAFPQTEIDGVRVQFPEGWALVRALATEPAVVFRFEACDWSALAALISRVSDALPEIGDTLWARYDEAMGLPVE
ncbi:MAG: hypothetical protein ACLQNE_06310 [Thermoguttaceae bacterium]